MSLRALLSPRSVAVVGASSDPRSPYARPLTYLTERGFPGRVYPVNPGRSEIGGVPCFAKLTDLPEPVDLVVVLTSASRVLETVTTAVEVGAGAVVVCSSGFAELGAEGRQLQATLTRIAAETGIRILGPNSQGLIYGPHRLVATFTGGVPADLPERGVAYVGQSGAIGGCLLDQAHELGLDVAAWVSTGNQADVHTVEAATALIGDECIDALLLYLESVDDGRAYLDLATAAQSMNKPLVVLRSGRSAAGQRANVSHTGATLSRDTAFLLASARHDVIIVDDLHEAVLAAQCAVALGRPRGNRVAIVTTSGGAGGIAADRCDEAGLQVPELSTELQTTVAQRVPKFGAVANPVDVTAQVLGDPSSVGRLCAELAESDEVDAVLALVTMVTGEQATALATDLAAAAVVASKPIVTGWLAGDVHTTGPRDVMRRNRLPVFRSIKDAVAVIRQVQRHAAIATVATMQRRPDAMSLLPPDAESVLVEGDCLRLLDAFGIARPPGRLVGTPDEASAAVASLAGPAVMKLQSPAVVHKSEVGGVRLNVSSGDAARVFGELIDAGARVAPGTDCSVLVYGTADAGLEMLAGVVSSDDGFPPVLSIGLGGVEADLHAERAHALLPIDVDGACDLIDRLPVARIIDGFRGGPGYDRAALADMLVRLGELSLALGDRLVEAEINPIRVLPRGDGALALDFLLRLGDGGSAAQPVGLTLDAARA